MVDCCLKKLKYAFNQGTKFLVQLIIVSSVLCIVFSSRKEGRGGFFCKFLDFFHHILFFFVGDGDRRGTKIKIQSAQQRVL